MQLIKSSSSLLIAGLAITLLTGCSDGGDSSSSALSAEEDSPTTSLSVTAIDGYLYNAEVCLDFNDDGVCDTSTIKTDEAGVATFELESIPNNYVVLVDVIAGVTIDQDNPTVPVEQGYRMSSLPDGIVATPLTTLYLSLLAKNYSDESMQAVGDQLREAMQLDDEIALDSDYLALADDSAGLLATYARGLAMLLPEQMVAVDNTILLNHLTELSLLFEDINTQLATQNTGLDVSQVKFFINNQGGIELALTGGDFYPLAQFLESGYLIQLAEGLMDISPLVSVTAELAGTPSDDTFIFSHPAGGVIRIPFDIDSSQGIDNVILTAGSVDMTGSVVVSGEIMMTIVSELEDNSILERLQSDAGITFIANNSEVIQQSTPVFEVDVILPVYPAPEHIGGSVTVNLPRDVFYTPVADDVGDLDTLIADINHHLTDYNISLDVGDYQFEMNDQGTLDIALFGNPFYALSDFYSGAYYIHISDMNIEVIPMAAISADVVGTEGDDIFILANMSGVNRIAQFSLYGGEGDDTFVITSTFNEWVSLNGGAGVDTFIFVDRSAFEGNIDGGDGDTNINAEVPDEESCESYSDEGAAVSLSRVGYVDPISSTCFSSGVFISPPVGTIDEIVFTFTGDLNITHEAVGFVQNANFAL